MNFEKQYGVTPPLSTEMPTEEQRRATDALLEELRAQGTFESAAETQKRYKVLESLGTVANAFVKRVAKEKASGTTTLSKDAIAKIFTFGSFRLGVYMPGSDIDALVLAPKYVTREEYFKYFPEMLQSMSPPGSITNLAAVPDSFMPIIKFEHSGISIDLIFSHVSLTQLPLDPNWSLKDSNLLRGLSDIDRRSVNGTRVTDEILDLVPEQRTFRDALRAIKLWARRRAIYANIMGYPGGVAWAMMVARVCQLYPKATGAVIVSKFFGIIFRWPWPNPVLLKPIEEGPLEARVWNPRIYRSDQYNLMPVITPAFPSMCATYNVSQSSLSIIKRELERASEMAQQIIDKRLPWKDLFAKHTFFTSDYKYYISVISASKVKDDQKLWSGLVESKVRMLVQGLDRHQSISIARVFNKGFERTHWCKNEDEMKLVEDGSTKFILKDDTESASEDKEAEGFKVYTMTHYIGIELEEGAKSLDLSHEVQEFKDQRRTWDKNGTFDKTCTLSIQHVRNIHLPDDVFEPGEVKPAKPVRAARAGRRNPPANTNGNKRRIVSEDAAPPSKRQQSQAPNHTENGQQATAVAAAAVG